ncbi:MAG: sigma-70 family RNA polymerase sigma factor, partial [Lentisphaeria bacterium]|nr:sigma-70 family RNA polymerase sigma factor [Lentisphaeria bacterium]
MANKRDSKKGTKYPRKEEELVLRQLNKSSGMDRLSLEEEQHHSYNFYNSRYELSSLLAAFPAILLERLKKCQTNEIYNDQLNDDIDQKEDVVKLLKKLSTGINSLMTTKDSGKKDLILASISKTISPYSFNNPFYNDCLDILTDLNDNFTSRAVDMKKKEFTKNYDELLPVYVSMNHSRSILLEANLRLAMSLARKYLNCGLQYEDLFQEGYVGLSIAVDKFQPQLGHRFSTYAVWWIRQSITQALSQHSRTIRIPANMSRALSQIKRAEQTLLQELGRDATHEEIADVTGFAVEKISAWKKMENQPISLESTVGDQNSSIGDFIVDQHTEMPDEAASRAFMSEAIVDVLDLLKEREREIIIYRYGLLGRDTKTLEELSA